LRDDVVLITRWGEVRQYLLTLWRWNDVQHHVPDNRGQDEPNHGSETGTLATPGGHKTKWFTKYDDQAPLQVTLIELLAVRWPISRRPEEKHYNLRERRHSL
jgi:hypothetical protein